MKKLYLFMASLLAFGSLQADEFRPEAGKVYYIQSTRSARFVKAPEANGKLQQVLAPNSPIGESASFQFQFEAVDGKENTYYIKNVGLNGYVNGDINNIVDKKETKTEWVIAAHANISGGFSIYEEGQTNGWNEEGKSTVCLWDKDDGGSGWKFLTGEEAGEYSFAASDDAVYFIKNDRSNNGQAYVSSKESGNFVRVTTEELISDDAKFVFEKVDGDVCYYIKNGSGKYVNNVAGETSNLVTEKSEAQKWYVCKSAWINGAYVIAKVGNGEDAAWHPTWGAEVISYSVGDDASCWYIESMGDVLDEQKKDANNLQTIIEGHYAFLPADSETLLPTLKGILGQAENTAEEKAAKFNALVTFGKEFSEKEMTVPANGLYRLVCTDTSGNRSGNEVMGAGVAHYAFTWQGETASRTIWNITFDTENGTCTLQNNLTKEYLHGATWGGQMTMQTDSHSFKFAAATGSIGKVAFGNDHDYSFIHMQGDGKVVGWAQGDGPSQWYVVPVTADEAASEAVAAAEQALADAEVNNAVTSVAGMLGVSASSAKLATSLNDYLDGTEAIYGGLYKEADGNIYRIKAVQLGNDNGLRAMAFDKDGDTDDLLFFDLYDAKNLNQLWKLEQSGNGFKLLNLNKGMYAGEINQDAGVKTSLADEGGIFGIRLNNADQKEIRLMNGNKGLNCETGGSITKYFVNNWDAGSSGIMNLELVEDVDISLNDGGDGKSYATAYLPFAVSGVTGAKAYIASAPADGKMELTEAANGVAANTGIVLIGDAAADKATVAIGEGAATESALQGTTVAKSVEPGSVLTLGKSGENVGFFTYTGTGLRANSAYLDMPADGAAALVLSFGDTDAIEGIEAATVKDSRMFDLSGRRVGKAGKGIYIVNGKKVIK